MYSQQLNIISISNKKHSYYTANDTSVPLYLNEQQPSPFPVFLVWGRYIVRESVGVVSTFPSLVSKRH